VRRCLSGRISLDEGQGLASDSPEKAVAVHR
jgi:hypothetical protein